MFDKQAQSCHSAARTPATLGRVSKHGVQYACCLPTPEMPFSSLFFTQPALLPCPGVFFTQAPLTWDSLPFLWDNYIFPSPGKPSPSLSLQSPRWVRNISRDIWFYFLKCVSVCVLLCGQDWVLDPLEMELYLFLRHLMEVLGRKAWLFGRALSALSHGDHLSSPHASLFVWFLRQGLFPGSWLSWCSLCGPAWLQRFICFCFPMAGFKGKCHMLTWLHASLYCVVSSHSNSGFPIPFSQGDL